MKKGFTLIEVVVVIILISILYSIVNPRFSNTRDHLILTEEAKIIKSFLIYLRNEAVSLNQILTIQLDNNKKRILLKKIKSSEFHNENILKKSEFLSIKNEVSIKIEPDEIRFFPLGTSDEYIIEISNDKNIIEIRSKGFSGIPEIIEK